MDAAPVLPINGTPAMPVAVCCKYGNKRYYTISFNSAQVVTHDPKYRFGTSATNNFWCDTSKNLAFKMKNFDNSAFLALPREIWPQCHAFYIWHWAP
jgi:hypothetical protein